MVRAAQTYLTLVETLGMRAKVLPPLLALVVNDTKLKFPELDHAGDKPMTLSKSMEVVSNWLERIADRDPVLFSSLLDKFNRARKEQKNKDSSVSTSAPTEIVKEPSVDLNNKEGE